MRASAGSLVAALLALASAFPSASAQTYYKYRRPTVTFSPVNNNRPDGRFLNLVTDPPAGGALYVPNLENTRYINNFTIDVTVPQSAYMVPPTFNGTGTMPCPEPCPYPDIQEATQADVDKWYWSWFTKQSVHVPWGYYILGYDRWCNNDHYLRMHYGDTNKDMGAGYLPGQWVNQTFVKDWYHFYVVHAEYVENRTAMEGHSEYDWNDAFNYSELGAIEGPQGILSSPGIIGWSWGFFFISGFQPTDWYMSSRNEYQPGYTCPFHMGIAYYKRNESIWNSIENPRCMVNQAIHYGPKLFCLQSGSGNQYTDTTPLCNLRNITLLGPGKLRLFFWDKKPTYFRNESLSEYTTYWDTWIPWDSFHRDAAQKTYVNFSASTWWDNSTGFDQRRDYHQDNIVALFPGGDGHNWARNNYTGTPGNRDTFGQILAPPKKLWTRATPKWTHVGAPWFRVNNKPVVAVRPAWSYACAMRRDRNWHKIAPNPGDGRCLVPKQNEWGNWPWPYYGNVDRWAPLGCTRETFWYNKTQFIMPPTPYEPSPDIFDYVPQFEQTDANRARATEPDDQALSWYPDTRELIWHRVFRGASGKVAWDYTLPFRSLTARINGSPTNIKRGYFRHMLRYFEFIFHAPTVAYPLRKLNRVYHAHEMYDVRSMPMCAPRQPNNRGGQEIGKPGEYIFQAGDKGELLLTGNFSDYRVYSKYLTMYDCRNTRGELYTEEVENVENVKKLFASGEIKRNATTLMSRWWNFPNTTNWQMIWNRHWNDTDMIMKNATVFSLQGPNYRLVWDANSDYGIKDVYNPSGKGAWYRQYGGVVKDNVTYGDPTWNFKEDISCPWFSKRENSDDFSFPGKRHYLHYDRSQGYDVFEIDTDYPADWVDLADPEGYKLHPGRNDTYVTNEPTRLATQYKIPRQERTGAWFSYNTTWACTDLSTLKTYHTAAGGRIEGALSTVNNVLYESDWNKTVITEFAERNIPIFGNLNGKEIRGAADACPGPMNGPKIRQEDRLPSGGAKDTGFSYSVSWKITSSQWSHPTYDPREWLIIQKVVGTTGPIMLTDNTVPPMFMHKSRAHDQCGGLYLNDLMNTDCDKEKDSCLESLPAYYRRKLESYYPFGTKDSQAHGWTSYASSVDPRGIKPRPRALVRTDIYNRMKCAPLLQNQEKTHLQYRRYGRFDTMRDGLHHQYWLADPYANDANPWASTHDFPRDFFIVDNFLQLYDAKLTPYYGLVNGTGEYRGYRFPYWNTTALEPGTYFPTWLNDTSLHKNQLPIYHPSNITYDFEAGDNHPHAFLYENWRHENSFHSFLKGCLVCQRTYKYPRTSTHPMLSAERDHKRPRHLRETPFSRVFHEDFYFTDHNNTNPPPHNWDELAPGATWDDCQSRPLLQLETFHEVEWVVTVKMYNATFTDHEMANPLEPWN